MSDDRASILPDGEPTAPFRDQSGNGAALLIIDMISLFDFEGAEPLVEQAVKATDPIRALRDECDKAGFPVIYVNDNFAEWHSQKDKLVERSVRSCPHIVAALTPRDTDYFIIKPQFSGFYATSLPFLLPKLGVRKLILTGVATDICVLFTAADAHMRDYQIWVPADAVAAGSDERGRWALDIMGTNLGCETGPTTALTIAGWHEKLRS